MFFLIEVAAALGVPSAVASTVVNVILGAGTAVTISGIISSIASGGATTLLTVGWAGFKATVQRLAKQSMARAIAY
ncbi:TPA: circular bacteriocin, circularin A/uberolysin family [Streptococcus suis]|nr:circular bacteriocin, circularin A/uberolysin family [Streptococcus suis]HEM4284628.1 circular bacteriocin, circularin A/uberolysin family [Streptococcus suis]